MMKVTMKPGTVFSILQHRYRQRREEGQLDTKRPTIVLTQEALQRIMDAVNEDLQRVAEYIGARDVPLLAPGQIERVVEVYERYLREHPDIEMAAKTPPVHINE